MEHETEHPRILIVEDEPLVRMLLVDQLRELGFLVEEAATAADALARFGAATSTLRAAVIDLGLPDRPGDDLVLDIRAIDPNLPILVASGYDEARVKDRLGDAGAIGYLGKPYDIAQLDSLLRGLGVEAPLRLDDI